MRKEVLHVEKVEDLNYCQVRIRVPDFQNFGEQFDALQEKANAAMLNDPDFPDFLKGATEMLNDITKSGTKSLEGRLKTLPEGPEKEQARQALEMIQKMGIGFSNADSSDDDEDDDWDEEDEENEGEEEKHDLQVLSVNLPEGAQWDKIYEAKLDNFLKEWPSIRPELLKKVVALYKELRPGALELYGEEYAETTLPEPASPDVVAQIFRIEAIYLHDDDRVGISGDCTWDEEHAFGAMIENGKILEVGAASDAY